MKAVFVTTFPNDVANVVAAWDCWSEIKSERIIFSRPPTRPDFRQPINRDTDILRCVETALPDVIFYIGAAGGGRMYQLGIETLQALREIAPSINLVFDGGDRPWHTLIEEYRRCKCFDLQVTIDGCLDSPVDFVTIAPVDTRLFTEEGSVKDIFCGISGNIGPNDQRSKIINPLIQTGLVKMRMRDVVGEGFPEHVAFMQRCQMIINTSYVGSGKGHHVKQRVFETGFAGAALLECVDAPTHHWIPPTHFFTYENSEHASKVIKSLGAEEVAEKGRMLQEHVRSHYTPQQVYGAMLDRL
ncbi:hypothetical protein LCGC14_1861680 [marine sediment metagenome]|uniref:DUF3880 domain-containing protein n=1 Tax=marine sediment metagenome TaxID=412755 RepID=A0A0F9GVQ5_9ZZZZ